MLQLLARDHEELGRFLTEGEELVKVPTDTEALKRQRWRFDRWITRHLHTLRVDIYPALEGRSDLNEVERLQRLSLQTEELLAAYERHKERFPLDLIDSDRSDYLDSAQLLIEQLQRLMDAQREQLYPLLVAAGDL